MIGLDTNVIVRYIMQDDLKQAALAASAIERLSADEPGHVAIVTVVELGWVLDSCYDLTRAQIGDAIEALLRSRELIVDCADSVSKALRRFRQGKADLADCLIAQIDADAGCTDTLTFDRDAARHAGMRLIS
jgi:predicted nucleic-acid-binding protein